VGPILPLLWLLASCGPREDKAVADEAPRASVRVHCAAAAEASVPDERLLRGTVAAAPDAYALIAAQVPGRITKIAVREGDAVRAGQVVAEIDARSYRDALDQAAAQLDQARSLVAHDETQVAREQRLYERGISARQQYEAASAAAEHDAAGAALARAAVSAAKANLERTVLRSPIAGIVLRVLRHPGELADGTPASAILEVADPRRAEFAASAAPYDLMALRPGQAAHARFASLAGKTFPLTVRAVPPAVDPATGVGSVRLAFEPSETPPPFGLFGDAVVRVGERTRALFVPEAALRHPAGSEAEVVVCDGRTARVRGVRVGLRLPQGAEIVAGLKAGELVAVDAVLGLEEGAPLEVLP
jgi:RND family efflux transporter MFP subunit